MARTREKVPKIRGAERAGPRDKTASGIWEGPELAGPVSGKGFHKWDGS